MTYFWASFWSNCAPSKKRKGGMALLTVQNNNNMSKYKKNQHNKKLINKMHQKLYQL